MWRRLICLMTLVGGTTICGWGYEYFEMDYGELLPGSSEQVGLWWASSGWKISRERGLPQTTGEAVLIRVAKNETEAAQLVVRPGVAMKGLTIRPGPLTSAEGSTIAAQNIDILEVRYVNVTHPTDKSSIAGHWPDPLPPLTGPVDLEANRNQPFWVRVNVPRSARAGIYEGTLRVTADGFAASVPLRVEVYGFELPDRMTCTTAFGFSPGNVFRYHGITDAGQRREVLEKYWANLGAHHISPYDPAPLDRIEATWPDVKPPQRKWQGGREVKNEKRTGEYGLAVFDDRSDENVEAVYEPLVAIPEGGLRLRFTYRTALPGQGFLVTLNHYDDAGQWISGGNTDIGLEGDGRWQQFDSVLRQSPKNAKSVQLRLRAANWTESGEQTGLVWFDDVSLADATTGEELIEGGGFEPPDLPIVGHESLQVNLDFTAWDKAMERAIDGHRFNSFRLGIPGLGGGTFHERREPELLGFGEDTPHYRVMFNSYCTQIQEHLRQRGWLDEAFVYWFDEPAPRDYAFVSNGFAKLKAAAPDIARMLTEQVEPALIGGPTIWCPVSNQYDHASAEQRRPHGEKFWWYVCTGPKAPYCTLFIDHPGTEMRVWLWQTWQRRIAGILVWQSNYWTSTAAYPDDDRPQNPYEDPMGWRSGYSTPKGEKRPWGNGDGRFIYPPLAAADGNPAGPVLKGPVDSIRWEMLRDGIEDYEYFVILRRLIEARGDKLNAKQRGEYAVLLDVPAEVTADMTAFTKDPAPVEMHRDRVARAIAALGRIE